jgi:hypothetical protein
MATAEDRDSAWTLYMFVNGMKAAPSDFGCVGLLEKEPPDEHLKAAQGCSRLLRAAQGWPTVDGQTPTSA